MSDAAPKRAMVTGAASGIGLAVAGLLSQRGCKLVLFYLDDQNLHPVVEDLNASGSAAFGACGSVSDPIAVKSAFETVDRELGGIDILVNNAGIVGNCAALELSLAAWNHILPVNLTGSFLCAQAAGSRMQSGGGIIVDLSSIYGLVAAPHRVAYSAARDVSRELRSTMIGW